MNISNNNSPIGFFDSGVGGLTVLKMLKQILPNESFIFFGDTLHVPYGNKSKNQLLNYSKDILKFFEKNNCKAVVMACNTTSSLIYEDIKDKYPFKLYPVVQSVANILAHLPIRKLGVFATKATVLSDAYKKEINRYNPNIEVYSQYCPEWVKIVENNMINDSDSVEIIKSDLYKMLSNNPEKIVLGCTHYPYLLGVLKRYCSEDVFIDPAVYLAEFIKNDLVNNNLISNSSDRFEKFYVSSRPDRFMQASSIFYNIESEPSIIEFQKTTSI